MRERAIPTLLRPANVWHMQQQLPRGGPCAEQHRNEQKPEDTKDNKREKGMQLLRQEIQKQKPEERIMKPKKGASKDGLIGALALEECRGPKPGRPMWKKWTPGDVN